MTREPDLPQAATSPTPPAYGGHGVQKGSASPGPGERRRWFFVVIVVVAVVSVVAGVAAARVMASWVAHTVTPLVHTRTPVGWHEIVDHAAEFAIPSSPEWQLEQDKTPDGVPVTEAIFRKGVCPGAPESQRAYVYILPSDAQIDPSEATATYAAQTAADDFQGRSPTLTKGPVEITPGGGAHVTVTATAPPVPECDAPAQVVHAVGLPVRGPNGQPQTLVLLAVADEGVQDALPPSELTTIANSFRRH